MLVRQGFEYRIKRRTTQQTVWTCNKEDVMKCKARLFTSGNTVFVKVAKHSHPPTYNGDVTLLNSQNVKVVYQAPNF